jgi:hypothetical protein
MSNLGHSTNDFDARLVIGPIQVGGLLSAALFGCLSCQSYVYFARFTNDHLILKAAVSRSTVQHIVDFMDHNIRLGLCSYVCSLFDLETSNIDTLRSFIQLGHFVCMISILWTMTVSTYGDLSQLKVLPLAADLAIPLSAFTAFIVQVSGFEHIPFFVAYGQCQSFYAFRLWKLTQNIFLPILCEIISAIAQVSTLILSSYAFSMTDLTTFEDNRIVLITLSLIARAVCDIITTISLVWSLRKKRRFDIEK